MSERERIANELMEMAARQSIKTQFGWVHPDCVTLREAARLLRDQPAPKPDDGRAIGVLSEST